MIPDNPEGVVRAAKSLYDRNYAPGNTGNISLRRPEGIIITPTNSCLGRLIPDELSVVGLDGNHRDGPVPSKEFPLHLEFYRARPDCHAIVHLHSVGSVAASCLEYDDPNDIFPVMTAYQELRIGPVALVSYAPPGSTELAASVRAAVAASHSVLLANHGSLVGRPTLDAALDASEQLEQTALLAVMLYDRNVRLLSTTGSSATGRRQGRAARSKKSSSP